MPIPTQSVENGSSFWLVKSINFGGYSSYIPIVTVVVSIQHVWRSCWWTHDFFRHKTHQLWWWTPCLGCLGSTVFACFCCLEFHLFDPFRISQTSVLQSWCFPKFRTSEAHPRGPTRPGAAGNAPSQRLPEGCAMGSRVASFHGWMTMIDHKIG